MRNIEAQRNQHNRRDLPVCAVGASCENWGWISVLETQSAGLAIARLITTDEMQKREASIKMPSVEKKILGTCRIEQAFCVVIQKSVFWYILILFVDLIFFVYLVYLTEFQNCQIVVNSYG